MNVPKLPPQVIAKWLRELSTELEGTITSGKLLTLNFLADQVEALGKEAK